MSQRPLSGLFDPREARVMMGLARWMSLLGRFQVVAAVFLFVVLLGVTGLVTTAELIEPASEASADAPLVTFGEVSRTTIALIVALVVAFSLLFLRGGMLLISGAEDLESVVTSDEESAENLEESLRRLRAYFVLESLLMVGVAAAAYAATIAGWGA